MRLVLRLLYFTVRFKLQHTGTPPHLSDPRTSNNSTLTRSTNHPWLNTPRNKHIHLPPGQRVKIGRQTNAKSVPGERNGFFDSKVLSRAHAEVWEEGGKARASTPHRRRTSRLTRNNDYSFNKYRYTSKTSSRRLASRSCSSSTASRPVGTSLGNALMWSPDSASCDASPPSSSQ